MKARSPLSVTVAFIALLFCLWLVFHPVLLNTPLENKRTVMLLFGPVASSATHLWLIGLVSGATLILPLILLVALAHRYRFVWVTLAIALWLVEGAFFSLGH